MVEASVVARLVAVAAVATTEAREIQVAQLRQVFPDMTQDRANSVLSEWELVPHFQDGVFAGIGLMRGSEFHCLVLPTFKLRRKEMREFLRPLFERHGMLTTRVEHSDAANQRFNKAFGFKKTWSDAQFNYFIMTELPFGERKKPCQQ